MKELFSKIINMPYHIRKLVLNRVYNVLMYILLLGTLFPIFWMIWTSFMSNGDIIEGKTMLQRAKYGVLLNKVIDKNNIMQITADGAVNKYDLKNNKLAKRKTYKLNNANALDGGEYVWLTSVDKGLIRVDPRTFKDKTARIKWSDVPLDYNKISKTYSAIDQQNGRIWLTLGYKDYDKIIEVDLDRMAPVGQFNVLSAFPYSFEKMAISGLFFVDGLLYVASNRGIAEIDPQTKKVLKVIEEITFSIAEVKDVLYDQTSGLIYFSSSARVYTYNKKNGQFKEIFTTITDKDGIEQINNIAWADPEIVLTTGHGLLFIDKKGKFIRDDFSPMFDDIDKKGHLVEAGRYVNSDVSAVTTLGEGVLLLGTSGGRTTIYDTNNSSKRIVRTVLVDKNSFLKIHWRNYIDLFHNIDFGLYLRNSFIICITTAIIAMFLATITAYALVRFDFPGNRLMSTGILATQMIPGVMMLIPIYIMFIKITQLTGIPIKGTFGGLIFVYSAFFLPFSIWILRGFFASIPISLEEAATIDGCTPFQVFTKIALPLSVPGVIATGIYIFLVAWDELMFAWVLTNAKTMTIPVGIRLFVGNFQNRYDLLMAASVVATIPVMIMFILLQKHIVSGLTSGAVKG